MAAAARPYWTGFLKLSLVTIAVRLYSATTEKERIHFRRIHEPSGERVRYQNVVPGLGPVDSSEIVKGYEYQKGRYVTVEPADLEKLRLETTDTIDIAEFVDADAVDPVYVDSPYYLVPDGSLAEDGYRVIRDALRDSGKAAIGQVVTTRASGSSRSAHTARVWSSTRCASRRRSAPPTSSSRRSPTSPPPRTSARSWSRSSRDEPGSSSPGNSSTTIKPH
jgi:hypothetical protein